MSHAKLVGDQKLLKSFCKNESNVQLIYLGTYQEDLLLELVSKPLLDIFFIVPYRKHGSVLPTSLSIE